MKAESNLGRLLGKSSRLLANQFNRDLASHGLTIAQWTLLSELWGDDKRSQKSLEKALLKDKATINSLISYLIKNGFISKEKDEKDKRSFIVSLTKKGKESQISTIPIAMKNIELSTQNISKEDLKTTFKVLNQVIINYTKENK